MNITIYKNYAILHSQILKCYLLLKLASHLVRTRTTMEISSTPIAFCVILGIVIMCNTIILYNMYLYC